IDHAQSARVTSVVVAVGPVVRAVAAAAIGTGIVAAVVAAIVTSLRRCRDRERPEQYEQTRYDQHQSTAHGRADSSNTVHCKLQHARADRHTFGKKSSTKVRPVAVQSPRQVRLRSARTMKLLAILRRSRHKGRSKSRQTWRFRLKLQHARRRTCAPTFALTI